MSVVQLAAAHPASGLSWVSHPRTSDVVRREPRAAARRKRQWDLLHATRPPPWVVSTWQVTSEPQWLSGDVITTVVQGMIMNSLTKVSCHWTKLVCRIWQKQKGFREASIFTMCVMTNENEYIPCWATFSNGRCRGVQEDDLPMIQTALFAPTPNRRSNTPVSASI